MSPPELPDDELRAADNAERTPGPRGAPPERVPTLTEVLEAHDAPVEPDSPPEPPVEDAVHAAATLDLAQVLQDDAGPGPEHALDEALVQRVLAGVQAEIDRQLDARLRAALAPVVDGLVHQVLADTRSGLASSLRDAVVQALGPDAARHRDGPGPR